jgi:endonuclease IV
MKLLSDVDHPNFATMVDTCHAHCCGIGLNQGKERVTFNGYPIDVIDVPLSKIAGEFIKRLKGHVGHVHLIDSDNTLNQHNTSTHVPLGEGVIDFDDVMKAIEEVGYTGWLVLDLCFWPNAWNATQDCKKYLDKLVDKFS